jgi:hypothetical protein
MSCAFIKKRVTFGFNVPKVTRNNRYLKDKGMIQYIININLLGFHRYYTMVANRHLLHGNEISQLFSLLSFLSLSDSFPTISQQTSGQ